MNLVKLFEVQKKLRDRINYNESDRFDKLVLALLVEVGECAQEWRGFKFWSKDQEQRTKIKCEVCEGNMEIFSPYPEFDMIECPHCDGTGIEKPGNPLLEEYVDGLHFVLEIGLEHGIDEHISGLAIEEIKLGTVERQFTALFKMDWEICYIGDGSYYHEGLELYISLGEMLGFTWEEIEDAYFKKNEINHARQDSGTY